MILSDSLQSNPLVSVIIPCFNQGKFLSDAIESVQKQTYGKTEIIVVDDGSTDHTRDVAVSFANVKYFYQANAGLSAARNFGAVRSNGLFLVFLDADDVLYPDGLERNLKMLLQNPSWAFVSGGHDKVNEWLYPLEEQEALKEIRENHYIELLRGNYIGMHAAVMYRCRVFDQFEFDRTLTACEDYDLYFKVARQHTVGCHAHKIAAYRRHGENMSGKFANMLRSVLEVHHRQLRVLKDENEANAWREGCSNWKHYYANLLYKERFTSIEKDQSWPPIAEMKILAENMPMRFKDYVLKKTMHNLRMMLKNALPDKLLKWLHQAGLYQQYTPPPGKIQAGDFNRLTPFSADFGFDRGGAIDRYYIENFLQENQERVRGHVLEIGDDAYTLKFGGEKILRSDILHIDHRNTRATYIGDITDVPQIPAEQFDCIIFTQTLHLIYDFKSALNTCYRILKPGGCLLLTVPGISHIDQGEWRDYWLWSFTDTSIKRLMKDTFNGSKVDIKTYGNVYVAAAFLYGMGLPEFRKEYLWKHDASYQVIISAAAVKA
jgi:glycosyltransferase involved in cell wall biosynthesis/SAM-dependent methyltransferase